MAYLAYGVAVVRKRKLATSVVRQQSIICANDLKQDRQTNGFSSLPMNGALIIESALLPSAPPDPRTEDETMTMRIEVCYPDPMPSDSEVRRGLQAAQEALDEAQPLIWVEQQALIECFRDWKEIPDSAKLIFDGFEPHHG